MAELPDIYRFEAHALSEVHGLDRIQLLVLLGNHYQRAYRLAYGAPLDIAVLIESKVMRAAVRQILNSSGIRPPERERAETIRELPGRICFCCKKRAESYLHDNDTNSARICCMSCFRESEINHPAGGQAGKPAPRELLFEIPSRGRARV
jgi:hypothetical protein